MPKFVARNPTTAARPTRRSLTLTLARKLQDLARARDARAIGDAAHFCPEEFEEAVGMLQERLQMVVRELLEQDE